MKNNTEEVLLICERFYPEFAGWIFQSLALFKQLEDIQFNVFTNETNGLRGKGQLTRNTSIERIYNPFKWSISLKRIYFLMRVLVRLIFARNKVKSVYLPFSFFPAEVVVLVCDFLEIRSVCRLSGGELKSKRKFVRDMRSAAYKKASYIIVLNTRQKKKLIDRGVEPDRIKFIPNSVDIDRFKTDSLKELPKVSDEKIVVGFVGYMTKRKGLKLLIEALQKIPKDKRQTIHLLIVGPNKARADEKEYYQEVNSLISKLDFSVSFTGRVDNIEEYYPKMDIYVLPSYSEGMPNAILEAMACGVAPVGSDIPGIHEVIEEGEDGFLFEPGNNKDLGEKLLRLYRDKDLRNKIGRNAQKTIKREHDLEKNANLYKDLLI